MRKLLSLIRQVVVTLRAPAWMGAAVALLLPISGLSQDLTISLDPLIEDLSEPVDIAHAGDGSGRLFIVERTGHILIWDGQALLPTPFLDIRHLTISDGERGLLGLTFHPDFIDNGWFFVHYSDSLGDTVVARYSVSADADLADPDSERIVLQVFQPGSNHNGGQIQFGPDGYLYIALGDGGAGADPANGQRLDTLLGKILRIDVDSATPYAIPEDNPFANQAGARPEIWAYGLRNPWRFSFDSATGDLFIADVGEKDFEEVNFQAASSPGGDNYGWRLMEGDSCFEPASGCNPGDLILPIIVYDHTVGQSVTGGLRYRGQLFPAFSGVYVYGDFSTGKIFAAQRISGGTWEGGVALDSDLLISTFGQDEQGELYVAHFDAINGAVFQIEFDDVTADNTDSAVVVVSNSETSGCFYSAVNE